MVRNCFRRALFYLPCFLCAFVTIVSVASAQPTPVFRSGVDLVRLDIRVLDNAGAPITDIRADEITITEQGQRRPVLLFQHIAEPRGTYLEAAARAAGGEVSTNEGAPRGHLYVMLFDQEHISPGAEQRARLAAQAFMRRRVRPQDRIAIYGLPGPGPQLDFTADVRRAGSELDKVRGGLSRTALTAVGSMRVYEAYQIARGNDEVLTRVTLRAGAAGLDLANPSLAALAGQRGGGGEDPAITRRLVTENARTIVAEADGHARRFLQMAGEVMGRLRAIEGRKTVVLFSEGFVSDNVQRELEGLAAAAAQSYSVVYAFDLNRRVPDAAAEEATGGEQFSEIQDRVAPLGSLAAETDGALVPDAASHMDRALNTLADASQDYYIVGFAPAAPSGGEYRRVKVTVSRAGARASVRTGYAVGPRPTPTDRRRALDLALGAPYTQQGLRVEYTTYARAGDAPGVQRVYLVLNAELPIATDLSRAADVAFVVRDARSGRVAASTIDTVPLPKQNSQGRATGIAQYRVQFELPSGEYLMRAVVREPGGLLGSADRRFTVRSTTEQALAASDLVVGRPGDVLPVRPRVFANGVLIAGIEVYGRAAADLQDARVTLSVEPVAANGAAGRTGIEGTLAPVQESSAGATRAARFELPLSGLSPGRYVARAVVRSGDRTVAEVPRELDVLPASAASVAAPTGTSGRTPDDPRNVLQGEVTRELITAAAAAARPGRIQEALALALSGNWQRAADRAGGAESEAPLASAVFAACNHLARADYPAAVAALDGASALDPANARLAFVLGWARSAAGDERGAIGAWRNAVTLDPKLVPAYLALADAYERLNQPALATQALSAGLKVLPDSPELRERLSQREPPQTRR